MTTKLGRFVEDDLSVRRGVVGEGSDELGAGRAVDSLIVGRSGRRDFCRNFGAKIFLSSSPFEETGSDERPLEADIVLKKSFIVE